MPALPASTPASRSDLEALPDNVVGEIIDGVLYTSPRPRAWHTKIESILTTDLVSSYQRGHNGPGGWWILVEPGIELPGAPEIVPDLAGWKTQRLPRLPNDSPIDVVPDWVCEILSPSTRRHDQLIKRPFYARAGVAFIWVIDLAAHTLTASKLVDGQWLEIGVYGSVSSFRAEPFDAVELSMAEWWPVEEETS